MARELRLLDASDNCARPSPWDLGVRPPVVGFMVVPVWRALYMYMHAPILDRALSVQDDEHRSRWEAAARCSTKAMGIPFEHAA